MSDAKKWSQEDIDWINESMSERFSMIPVTDYELEHTWKTTKEEALWEIFQRRIS